MSKPRVLVIIVNYNGWRDTVACLESLFRQDYPAFRVAVCDNASTDGSLAQLEAWATGRVGVDTPADHPLYALSHPPIPKPVPYKRYTRAEAETPRRVGDDAPLLLIDTGENLGFAGGNNVGLRYALAQGFDYVWLLNNDTVVAPDALAELVRTAQARPDVGPELGVCGSLLLHYHDPGRVQAVGGRFNRLFATGSHVGEGWPAEGPLEVTQTQLDYLVGASLLVSRAFLEQVGLMDERYFLYFEEIDWAVRGGARFAWTLVPTSRVYHKEGGSAGSDNRTPASKSTLSDYYSLRNRLLFTRTHHPHHLVTVYLGLVVAAVNRLRRRQWSRALMVLKIMVGRSS